MSSVDDMPPALPAMWRALKRGYQAEPLLLSVSFGLSLLAALPDALLALWLKLLADGALAANRALVIGAPRSWCLCGRDVVFARDQRPYAAAFSRPRDDRARIARGAAAGVGVDDRSPRTSRISRPARGAARSGIRARPHVHVAVFDLRLDPAPRRDRRTVDVDSLVSGAVGRFRVADGVHVDVASRRRTCRRRTRRFGKSAGPSSVPDRDDGAARQRSARDADR